MSLSSDFVIHLCPPKQCLEVESRARFYLMDSQRDSDPIVVEARKPGASRGGYFEIENSDVNRIYILKVDGCWADTIDYQGFVTRLCHEGKARRCECILFNDSHLCFVEIKNNRSGKNVKKHREDAYCQIENTYLNLHNLTVPHQFALSQFKLEGYIALSRGGKKAANSTKFRETQDYFWDTYKIRLYANRKKVFDSGEL